MLEIVFKKLLSQYTASKRLINDCWTEIVQHYTEPTRHYHNLQHLENLLAELTAVQPEIHQWDGILFTLFYHDLIYQTVGNKNEERSAAVAVQRLAGLNVPADIIARCKMQILATKSHERTPDSDTNYFLDADLAILGSPWPVYSAYYQSIRKEYARLPDIVYRPGRKKVIQRFLAMDRIFKTGFFYDKCETRARYNLQKELAALN